MGLNSGRPTSPGLPNSRYTEPFTSPNRPQDIGHGHIHPEAVGTLRLGQPGTWGMTAELAQLSTPPPPSVPPAVTKPAKVVPFSQAQPRSGPGTHPALGGPCLPLSTMLHTGEVRMRVPDLRRQAQLETRRARTGRNTASCPPFKVFL